MRCLEAQILPLHVLAGPCSVTVQHPGTCGMASAPAARSVCPMSCNPPAQVLVYAGVRVAGRAAVVAHLAAVAERHAAYGSAAYDLDAPDAQAVQARLLLCGLLAGRVQHAEAQRLPRACSRVHRQGRLSS